MFTSNTHKGAPEVIELCSEKGNALFFFNIAFEKGLKMPAAAFVWRSSATGLEFVTGVTENK